MGSGIGAGHVKDAELVDDFLVGVGFLSLLLVLDLGGKSFHFVNRFDDIGRDV